MDQYFFSLSPSGEENISYIPQVQLPITLRCTLRCKECSTYTPYCKNNIEDFDCDSFVQAVDKLLRSYDTIGNILLYGGEPLLHKDLYRLVNMFAENTKIEKVTVVTNGTLMPDKQLLESLRRPNVLLRISDYGPLSRRKDELINLLHDSGVNLEVTDFEFWNKNPTVDVLNETEAELQEKVAGCCIRSKILTIIQGKIFTCSHAAYYNYHKAVPNFDDDYVDLLNFSGSDLELKNRVDTMIRSAGNAVPMNVCKYCSFQKFADNLPVAEQTTEHLQFKKVY